MFFCLLLRALFGPFSVAEATVCNREQLELR